VHDFKLFQNSGVRVGDLIKIIADKGYQGIAKIHKLSETPIKRKKGKKLSKEEKQWHWFSLIVRLKPLQDKDLTENTQLKKFLPS
jgi:hypothetical protein